MFTTFLVFLLAASPVLAGRVADSHGKPIAGATVRIQAEDGRTAEVVTDNRGAFRLEIGGRSRLEIKQDGYRTVRSSTFSLSSGADDVYEMDDVRLTAGSPDDVETLVVQLEEVVSPESRGDPNVREGLPKSDRLFGMRGGVNVTNIREGSGQQWLAASGSVRTASGCRQP